MNMMRILCCALLCLAGSRSVVAESTVTFYGGAGQVGGTSAVVQNGGKRVLVDCGTFYGDENSRTNDNSSSSFGFDPTSINAMVLTHAHQDHFGRIPQLVRSGFKGEILMTAPTLALLRIVLRSQLAYENDAHREWVWTARDGGGRKFHWRKECKWAGKVSGKNRRAFSGSYSGLEAKMKHDHGDNFSVSPCRSCRDAEVESILSHVRVVSFEECVTLAPFKIVLRPVKHLPGAAAVYFDDGASKFVFSGDLGTRRSRFVEWIDPAEPVDDVFLESTYGNNSVGGKSEAEVEYGRFRDTVGRTVASGGIAWIPAFALDRSQRVLAEIARGIGGGSISGDVPIYYLSPSSREITEQYLSHPEWFDNSTPSTIGPLYKRSLRRFNPKKHKGPAILLTTSGMMDMGFSYDLIPVLAPRPDVVICQVGYQSPLTCGGQLKRGDRTLNVVIDGVARAVSVGCRVESFWCFSGHGDASENDAWLSRNSKAHIHLVHGDLESLNARKAGLQGHYNDRVDIVQTGVPVVIGKK